MLTSSHRAVTKRKTGLTRLLVALCVSALLFCMAGCDKKDDAPVKSQSAPFTLTVLHTNDVHSNYGGFTDKGLICYAPSCEGGKGGSVRLDRAVRAINAEETKATILLDAGDEFQGTLYWTVHENAPATRLLDLIGYTAFVPGNHEFDNGCEPFLQMAGNIKVPVVAANLSFKNNHAGASNILPWVVVERQGRKIGIVGITTSEIPNLASPCPDALFAPETETLKNAVGELTAQGVDIIIALTHIGLEDDKALAKSVDGVDVFVGGHSHSLLSGTLPKAEGPYPVIEQSPSGNPVLIVSAGNASSWLGRLDVSFDARGVPISWKGDAIVLDDATLTAMNAPDANPDIVKAVDELSNPVQAMIQSPIGEIVAEGRNGLPLEQDRVLECRASECLTGNVVTDALLASTFPDTEIVLLNGGALRNSLPGGQVTAGDVLATLPFQNTPFIADMPGTVIKRALEHGVVAYGEGKGSFIQPAGLRYEFDPDKPAGARVTVVETRNKDGEWETLDETRTYRVVSLDFLTTGGDGFDMFKGLNWKESDKLLNDVLRIYLKSASPVKAEFDGRIRVVIP